MSCGREYTDEELQRGGGAAGGGIPSRKGTWPSVPPGAPCLPSPSLTPQGERAGAFSIKHLLGGEGPLFPCRWSLRSHDAGSSLTLAFVRRTYGSGEWRAVLSLAE